MRFSGDWVRNTHWMYSRCALELSIVHRHFIYRSINISTVSFVFQRPCSISRRSKGLDHWFKVCVCMKDVMSKMHTTGFSTTLMFSMHDCERNVACVANLYTCFWNSITMVLMDWVICTAPSPQEHLKVKRIFNYSYCKTKCGGGLCGEN